MDGSVDRRAGRCTLRNFRRIWAAVAPSRSSRHHV